MFSENLWEEGKKKISKVEQGFGHLFKLIIFWISNELSEEQNKIVEA